MYGTKKISDVKKFKFRINAVRKEKVIMKKCLIVGSAPTRCFNEKEKKSGVLYIAADGGYGQMKKQGIVPDILIGDFDSLSLSEDIPEEIEVIRHPVEKDDTDTMLAVKTALTRGYRDIVLYGCFGGERFDHSIATLQTLTYTAEKGAKAVAVGDSGEGKKPFYVTAIKDSEIIFSEDCEGTFSVMSAGGICIGVSIENAKYNLNNATVTSSFPIGVSNSFIKGKKAKIFVKSGTLWVFY